MDSFVIKKTTLCLDHKQLWVSDLR